MIKLNSKPILLFFVKSKLYMRRIIYILANVILSAIIFASCSGVDEENTVNGFEYVDLGLPSGTIWAASNIGAKAPESAGSYFAWGEISESNYYTEAEFAVPLAIGRRCSS